MASSYVIENNPNKPFYPTRNGSKILMGVLHIVTGAEDFEAPDLTAEKIAKGWALQTSGSSWHVLVDADSTVECLPDTASAWHCGVKGHNFNNPSLGMEICLDNTNWSDNPKAHTEGILKQMAKWWGPRVIKYDIPMRLVTDRDEIDRLILEGKPVGFTYHAVLDPSRRTDPGMHQGKDTFPWQRFLALLTAEVIRLKGDARASAPAVAKPSPKPQSTQDATKFRVLRSMMSGPDVRALQVGMNRVFPSYSKLVADGRFGPNTEKVIAQFQRRVGLTPDGIVGPRTKAELNKRGVRF